MLTEWISGVVSGVSRNRAEYSLGKAFSRDYVPSWKGLNTLFA